LLYYIAVANGRSGLVRVIPGNLDEIAGLQMLWRPLDSDTGDPRISTTGEREVFLNFGGGRLTLYGVAAHRPVGRVVFCGSE